MTDLTRPGRDEASEYYFKYIDLVPEGDICHALETQLSEMTALFQGVAPDRIDYRYAPDKWSVREVLSHLNDTERLFVFRAFWFARGFEEPLPSFDPDIARRHAGAGERSWQSHVDELRSLRESTVLFFRGLPEEAWRRSGTASGMPFSVRALAYLAVGHVIHHVAILRERYGL
jgi:hypothetical protein